MANLSGTTSNWSKVAMSAQKVWNRLQYSFSMSYNETQDESDNTKWKIKPKKKSTTISVNPDIFDNITSELKLLYGEPVDKGQFGCIYRCTDFDDTTVTITCYESTSTISVQGTLHVSWVDSVLHDIGLKLDSRSPPQISTSSTPASDIHTQPNLTLSPLPQFELSMPSASILDTSADTDSKLADEIRILKTCNEDLKQQLAQLTEAYSELSDRNSVLQAKLDSMTINNFEPTPCKSSSSAATPNSVAGISTSNPFNVLDDQVNDGDNQVNDGAKPAVPSAPSISLLSPEKPALVQSSQPKTQVTSPDQSRKEQKNVDILIFSNSICSRINTSRFFPGKTTEVHAVSGGRIQDIQRKVLTCEDKSPQTVVLQAWTNNTTTNSAVECHNDASRLINTVLKKYPTAHVIISGVLPRLCNTNQSNFPNLVAMDLNDIFAMNCRNNSRVSFIDHSPSFTTPSGVILHHLYWDNVHLNNRGLGRLVTNLRMAINNVNPQRYHNSPKT